MKKKRIAIALGHDALGTTLPEQKEATCRAAKAIADLIQDDCQVVITHSNGPQIGMIHTAMSEFHRLYTDYTATPMSVCSAMSQGYIGIRSAECDSYRIDEPRCIPYRIHTFDTGYRRSL